ncbi:MAG: UDP-N-acetylmuramoyl-L-alanyl-D-glutamate--2,6-diaminopimelate ligase [Nitrosomonas sp.]|nr:UDP-N-acetylmuramoyl-L-alanyl-D-glutamate--2,6-diaminopimelate ligase [Nitrosomonas sp.]
MLGHKPPKVFSIDSLDALDLKIHRLVTDSRELKPGDTFIAYAGENFDARQDIPEAIAIGVNAIIWEKKGFTWDPRWQLPNLAVTHLRQKAGLIASHLHDYPSRRLWLVGITGTNGKTSCSHWFAQAMTALGKKTAVIGTLGHGFANALTATTHTTPDAAQLQQLLAEFVQQQAQSVVMEASSHGLDQGRLTGAEFSVAVLTNLSHDHLDYHGTMDSYAATKAKLFFWPGLKSVVLNLDEVLGVELSRQLENKAVQVIGYGFKLPREGSWMTKNQQVLFGSNIQLRMDSIQFDVVFSGRQATLQCQVAGRFNAYNLLAVLATLIASGVDFDGAVQALRQIRPVPGRMELLGGGKHPVVIVDYAHTPDALSEVLAGLRETMASTHQKPAGKDRARLICVTGCGGDRDRSKRPLIGEIAARLADEVIFTSDNPRSERPEDIIMEMLSGIRDTQKDHCIVEIDRSAAIYRAIQQARRQDVVLIAGKGAEMHQQRQGRKCPHDDRKIVRQVLRDLVRQKMQEIAQ